jgi:hypothetical protein
MTGKLVGLEAEVHESVKSIRRHLQVLHTIAASRSGILGISSFTYLGTSSLMVVR